MAKESIAALRRRIAELKGAGRELSAQELDEIPALYRRIGEIGAERRTAYERGRVPLFADQIPETEPIDYQAAEDRMRQKTAALHRKHRHKAVQIRRMFRERSISGVYEATRQRWNRFGGPHTPEYAASFWRDRYREAFHVDPDGLPIPEYAPVDPLELDARKNGLFQG